MASSTIDKPSRIAIVGAGPAGLSTAWFLSKQGFHNVTVLEKLGRVGGLCKSLTVDGMSFDLGANYVTWAYQETLAIAKEVGASTYAEKPYTSIDVAPDRKTFKYRSLFDAVLNNPYTGAKVSLISFLLAAVRYLSIRSRLSDVIDIPDYLDRIHEHPDLCVSFKDWLDDNSLMPLATLFQFPITIMGYGRLEEIAAPYALRYMSLRTFLPMVFGRPPVSWIVGSWPRRFTDGFQRLWERVSWRTNVRLNVNITKITRSPAGIRIDMEYPEQQLDKTELVQITDDYDYLILACPLTPDVFAELGLAPNQSEHTISEAIQVNPYCMTTFWIDQMNMPEPIAPLLPLPEPGTPWAVAQQYQDKGNMFTQFYTRPTSGQTRRTGYRRGQEPGIASQRCHRRNPCTLAHLRRLHLLPTLHPRPDQGGHLLRPGIDAGQRPHLLRRWRDRLRTGRADRGALEIPRRQPLQRCGDVSRHQRGTIHAGSLVVAQIPPPWLVREHTLARTADHHPAALCAWRPARSFLSGDFVLG